ncbi:myb family transcription factor EFM-like [Curcuma longa]|uniref:myb family transcription factor EFM-like n=1 Tax=Curcuma longa TaxID=136217 RepID=UPI003D9F231E
MVPSALSDMALELSLCAMRSVGGFLKEASTTATASVEGSRAARLEEFINRLDEEKRKIEAFKRELPLSVRLLGHVIEGLNREANRCRGEKMGFVFEELKNSKVAEDGGEESERDCKDKKNWMSSAQLWSDNYSESNDDFKNHDKMISQEEEEEGDRRRHRKGNLFLEHTSRNGRGAFVPFKGLTTSCKEEQKSEVSLHSPAINEKLPHVKIATNNHRAGNCGSKASILLPEPSPAAAGSPLSLQQSSRKSRRCWSQELHRCFVLAIQQLGGAQVATPKQIRQQMKVDGLTNDEVKSHLQKYRLHGQRVTNASAITTQSSQHSVSLFSPPQLGCSTYPLSVTGRDSLEEDGNSESFNWR